MAMEGAACAARSVRLRAIVVGRLGARGGVRGRVVWIGFRRAWRYTAMDKEKNKLVRRLGQPQYRPTYSAQPIATAATAEHANV